MKFIVLVLSALLFILERSVTLSTSTENMHTDKSKEAAKKSDFLERKRESRCLSREKSFTFFALVDDMMSTQKSMDGE